MANTVNDKQTCKSTPRKELNFYDPLLESLADGVFAVDCDWKIINFNRAAELITGIPREEAIGQRCYEVFKASICETECALKKAKETGKPIIDKPIFIINNKGDRVPVSISAAVLKDENGQMIGGVESFRDLSEVEALKKALHKRYSFADIISRSPQMQAIFEILPEIAASSSTVLITGESGTGKELTARAIHHSGPRKNKPFIAVNCSAIPDTLLESELFGYKKGAFTDARTDKPGRFALAKDGTLFLDEIGDISPNMQAKLLRVLEDKKYEPLGATQTEISHARIIAATNKNLKQLVEEGRFREDLYYRINVITMALPPLRERMEDVPLLVDHFIHHFNKVQHKHILGITPNAMKLLMNYDYPGNIRELQNFIEHAFVLCHKGMIDVRHLPASLRTEETDTLLSDGMTLDDLEKTFILHAMKKYDGNQKKVAEALGIHRTTLYRKLKRYGIDISETK